MWSHEKTIVLRRTVATLALVATAVRRRKFRVTPACVASRRVTAPARRSLPEAVVLGKGPNALGAVRGLALARVPVDVVSPEAADPVMRSRYAQRKLVFPGALTAAGTELCDYLEAHLAPGSVLIPTSDVLVQWMAAHRSRLEESFRFCLPSNAVLELLLDKARQVQAVQSFGIPVPQTAALTQPLEEIVASLWFPVIVKPTTPQALRDLGEKNRIAATPAQLREFVREYHELLSEFLVQEMIPGPDSRQWVCNCTFAPGGRLAQAFVFQRLSLYPTHRGQTSYARSRSNPEVVALVEKIGRALEYVGPAMMEFKLDERDGQYKYFETNPRLGQCNFFDTWCGVNNVHAAYLLALGRELPTARPPQRNDVMFLNLLFDVRGRLADQQGIVAIAWMYLRDLRLPHVGQWQYWRDPLPGLVFDWLCLYHGLRERLTGRPS